MTGAHAHAHFLPSAQAGRGKTTLRCGPFEIETFDSCALARVRSHSLNRWTCVCLSAFGSRRILIHRRKPEGEEHRGEPGGPVESLGEPPLRSRDSTPQSGRLSVPIGLRLSPDWEGHRRMPELFTFSL